MTKLGIIFTADRPPVIRWARERIDEGRLTAGRGDPHRLTVFIKGRVDANRGHAIAEALLQESVAAQLAPLNRDTDIAALRAIGDPATIAPQIPDDLLDQLTATGTPEQVIASLKAIADTGVDSIAFAPIGPNPDEQLQLLAQSVMPAFDE